MNSLLFAAAESLVRILEQYYESEDYVIPFKSKDIADCVVNHAAASGAAAMAAGVLPGAGSVVALAIAAGAIWRMYIQICKLIGFAFERKKLKAISSAVITNIVTQLTGAYAIEVVASFIPGASIVVVGIGNFVTVYFAGLIFLNVLTKVFKVERKDVNDMDEEAWNAAFRDSAKSFNAKVVFKEAKSAFSKMKRDGSLYTVSEKVDISGEDSDEQSQKL